MNLLRSMAKNFTKISLSDGRSLAWRQYGDPTGYPIIFTHGVFNSRLFEPAWDKTQELTEGCGARLIAVDRPGYGHSDFFPDRSYLSWAADVTQLSDHLQLEKFAVLGYSSGGPSALACAQLLPERVSACGICSSDGPYVEMGGGLVELMHGSSRLNQEDALRNATKAHDELAEGYGGMKKKDRAEIALADLAESVRQGIDSGPTQDGQLESAEWGVDLGAIKVPVLLWHGTDDKDVPVAVGRYLADKLATCESEIVEGENHTMIRRRWGAILTSIIETATDSQPKL